ncbi:MAG: PilZ domain-containing protein, partial [Myxococcota bacterium]|nr:PilZ domain-containing protein [Myxococcota bacterium]
MSTQTVSLKITLRYKDVDEFAKRYAENISSAGLFLRTRTPKPTGSKIRFELLLSDGSHVLRGDGVVVNTRQDEKPGMAIRFNVLDGESWANVEKVVGLHGNGSLAPTPLGAPFRTVAPSGGASSSRRVRTSLRAGGVGKGTGSVRSPFAGASAPAGASWSAPPPPREPATSEMDEDTADENEPNVSKRPSMLARPWATGRQADIDTSEIRTARISQFGMKDDKLEVPAPVDADVPEETAKLSPAEFLNRASELRKRVASSIQSQTSQEDNEDISIAPASPEEEASQLAKSHTESDSLDAELESVLSENTASDSDRSIDGHDEFLSSQESQEDELALVSESIADKATSEIGSTGSTDADAWEAQASELNEPKSELAAEIDDDDWASAFDDFPESSLPTKVVTPTDPVPDESFFAELESEGSVEPQETALKSTNERIGSLSDETTVELESGSSTEQDENLTLSEDESASPEGSFLEPDDESENYSDEYLVQGVLEDAPEFSQEPDPEASTSDFAVEEDDDAQSASAVENEENVVSESPEMDALASGSESANGDEIQEDFAAEADELRQVPTDFGLATNDAEPFPETHIRLKSPGQEPIDQENMSLGDESGEALDEVWSAFAETPEIGDPAAPPLSEVLADASSVEADDTSLVPESSDLGVAAGEGNEFENSQYDSEESALPEMEFESDLPIDEPLLDQTEGMSEDGTSTASADDANLSDDENSISAQEGDELDERAISGSGFDEASENELFKVVDNLFEVDSDEEPLPKLRASVAPDILNSPPLIDEVVEKAVQAERESTGEFVGPSNEAIELASSETNESLENLLQARSVARDDSDLIDNPPADFAMHEAQTRLAHETVSDEELADDSTRVKSDELINENPSRLSMDVAEAFDGKNEATVIEESAQEYLSSLPSPARIDTIEPPKNLVSEIIPDRPISAETRAEPNQEHWTHSEIERGYSVDISSHIQSSRPAKEATVAIDLGGQWLRVAQNKEGSLVPIQIEGLTHYPASIGLYENYEVAQGAELLEVEQSTSLEIVSIMQLLRVLQGEPYASKEYVGKVRAEANGRCIAELIGKKWNLGDLLRAFFSPVGAAINEEFGSSKTWVKLIVPAGTNEQVKSLLLEACEDAGLGVYDFVNDVDAIL